MIETLIAAATMGLLGSMHCAVMCGPLAIAGCRARAETAGYFGGRAFAHALGGAIFGSLGHAIALGPSGSVLLGALLFGYGLSRFRTRDRSLVSLPQRRHPALRFLARLLPRRGLGLGLATGALPCGLLFGAWVLASSTHDPLRGAAVMLVFSLASLPGLIAPLVASRFARVPPHLHGVLWCALALFVALRPFLALERGCH